MYQTLEDLEKIQNDQETPNKQKKWLKWILIALGTSIILTGAWAGLTKAGIIPNWFDIEFLNLYLSDEYGKCVDCNGKIVEGYKIKMFVEDNNGNRCCEGTYSLKFIDDKHQYYGCEQTFSGEEFCGDILN